MSGGPQRETQDVCEFVQDEADAEQARACSAKLEKLLTTTACFIKEAVGGQAG